MPPRPALARARAGRGDRRVPRRATASSWSSCTSTGRATTPRRERSFTEPGLTHLSFSVDDLAATCDLVTEQGGEVLTDTDIGGLAIMVRDPDGQLLELLPTTYRSP